MIMGISIGAVSAIRVCGVFWMRGRTGGRRCTARGRPARSAPGEGRGAGLVVENEVFGLRNLGEPSRQLRARAVELQPAPTRVGKLQHGADGGVVRIVDRERSAVVDH